MINKVQLINAQYPSWDSKYMYQISVNNNCALDGLCKLRHIGTCIIWVEASELLMFNSAAMSLWLIVIAILHVLLNTEHSLAQSNGGKETITADPQNHALA